MNRALFERNAMACETARFPECRCACGGAFHGQKHSAAWVEKTWREIQAREPSTADLFEDAERDAARARE